MVRDGRSRTKKRERREEEEERERGEVELWNLSRYGGPDGQLGLLLRSSTTTTTTTTPTISQHSLPLLLFRFCCCLSTILRLSFDFCFIQFPLFHPWPIMADSEYSPKFAPFFSFVGALDPFGFIKYAWKWLTDSLLGWHCLCSEYTP